MMSFKEFLKEADIVGGSGGRLTSKRPPSVIDAGSSGNDSFLKSPRSRPMGPGPSSLSKPPLPAYSGSSGLSGPRGPSEVSPSQNSLSPRMNLKPQDTDYTFTPHSPRNPSDTPRVRGGLAPGGSFYKDLKPGNQEPLTDRGFEPPNTKFNAEGGKKDKKKK